MVGGGWRAWAAVVCAVMLAACGGSASHSSTTVHRGRAVSVCSPAARAAVARGVGVAVVSYRATVSSGGYPTCVFTARLPDGRRVGVSVTVERTVEAYTTLERTIEEASQVFTPSRLSPAPITVSHLGLDASWFPAEQHVMTTDGRQLVTATVDWPGVTVPRRKALAVAAARAYLGPLDWKAADPAGS